MSTDGGTEPSAVTVQPSAPTPSPQPFVAQDFLILSLPFAVFSIVLLIRAMPWTPRALSEKPLSCDACMSFWVSIIMGFFLGWLSGTHWSWPLLHMLAAPGGALVLLALHRWLTAPRELPLPPIK